MVQGPESLIYRLLSLIKDTLEGKSLYPKIL